MRYASDIASVYTVITYHRWAVIVFATLVPSIKKGIGPSNKNKKTYISDAATQSVAM